MIWAIQKKELEGMERKITEIEQEETEETKRRANRSSPLPPLSPVQKTPAQKAGRERFFGI
jgi:hypothetical protein